MDKRDFLKHVTATQGYYCILGIRRGQPNSKFFDNVDDAASHCEVLAAQEYDVYFGCAKFRTNENRLATNAKYFKSFWLDVDCGPKKDYLDKETGLNEIERFCTELSLPFPTVVDSGNGLHCYWVLTNEISYNEWKPVADFLKQTCVQHGLKADPSVTSDAARILRVPDTFNFKSPTNKKEVKVIEQADALEFNELKTLLNFEASSGVYSFATKDEDDTTERLAKGVIANFSRIMKLSLKGKGCHQLVYAYTHQNEMSEPMWRSALSVPQYCEDRDKAIHLMSRQHDDYDPYSTEQKANGCKTGAHTCKEFQRVFGAERCETCIHKGAINSPIKLGVYVPEATPEDNIVVVRHKGLGEETTLIIPTYPKPYFRGVNGGVYLKKISPLAKDNPEGDQMETDVLIYENDLYIEKRLKDEEYGEMALVKLHMPRDGVEEFVAPLQDILSKDKARTLLASKGVSAMDAKMTGIMAYLAYYVHCLQNTDVAEIARSQFGWHDGDESFIIGTRQIRVDGVSYSPPSTSTAEFAPKYSHQGHLSEWSKIANLYGRPGNEARAFALGVSFGSPLVRFSGIKGFILHLTNQKSGVGKTTIQLMVNSVWGHPEAGLMTFDDKPLARQLAMGVIKNMPMCIDEITDLSPEEIGHIAYMISQGKGRDRMQSQHNALRKNRTTWQLPCITSGNNSIYDVLMSYKSRPEGEMMRVLEIFVDHDSSLTKDQSDVIFTDNLYNNYGMAGEIIIKYMLNNREECIDLFRDIRREFDEKANFSQKHRFYSAACAVSLAGLEIAKRCHLHDIDVQKVTDWAIRTIGETTITMHDESSCKENALGEFLNEVNGSIFVGFCESLGGLEQPPLVVPQREVMARFDVDTKLLSVSASALRKWCAKKQLPYKGFLDNLANERIYAGPATYKLMYGFGRTAAKVKVEQFHMPDLTGVLPDLTIA